MTAFRAAFKAYRMHQVLIMPRFARLTIALGLATAVFPVDAEYYFNPRFLSNDLAESVDLSAFTKGQNMCRTTAHAHHFRIVWPTHQLSLMLVSNICHSPFRKFMLAEWLAAMFLLICGKKE